MVELDGDVLDGGNEVETGVSDVLVPGTLPEAVTGSWTVGSVTRCWPSTVVVQAASNTAGTAIKTLVRRVITFPQP